MEETRSQNVVAGVYFDGVWCKTRRTKVMARRMNREASLKKAAAACQIELGRLVLALVDGELCGRHQQRGGSILFMEMLVSVGGLVSCFYPNTDGVATFS